MTGSVLLEVGARFAFDGEIVEVVQLEGIRVSLRDARGRWRTVSLSGFLAQAVVVGGRAPVEALGTRLAALTEPERVALAERAGHVREVLTGYRSGTGEVVRAGEPRAEYAPDRPVRARQAAKAAELGVSERTVRRWVRAYHEAGEAGLLDERHIHSRHNRESPQISRPWRGSSKRYAKG